MEKEPDTITDESAQYTLSRNPTKPKHLWHASAGVIEHLGCGYLNCNFLRMSADECEDFPGFPSLLWRQNACGLWALLAHVIAVGSTEGHIFVYNLSGAGKELFPDIKPAELCLGPTHLSLFQGCRRGKSYSYLLVPSFMSAKAAHGSPWAAVRWDQSPATYLLVFLHSMAES